MLGQPGGCTHSATHSVVKHWLRRYIGGADAEIDELNASGVYCVGVTDASFASRACSLRALQCRFSAQCCSTDRATATKANLCAHSHLLSESPACLRIDPTATNRTCRVPSSTLE